MSDFDSAEVLALKAKLEEPMFCDGSDWARYYRGRLHKQIRSQRLKEARAKGTHTPEQWDAIVARYEGRCVRCGCYPDPRPCKDHIVPLYQGGSDGAGNLQPLCRQCNTAKGPCTFDWAAYRDEHGFEDDEE